MAESASRASNSPFFRKGKFRILFPLPIEWSVTQLLRIILAVVFALVAFIFSEVVPDVPPFNRSILRSIVTVWFGLMGYGLFADLARVVTTNTINLVNSLVTRVGLEVMNQMVRLQHPGQHQYNAAYPSHAPVSGVSINQP